MDITYLTFVLGAVVTLLILARLVNQFLMRERLTDALTEKDRLATGIALSGYLFGVMMIIIDVLSGEGHNDWLKDFLLVGIYGLAGIVFLVFVSVMELRLILSAKALDAVREGNVAAAITVAASYIATSQIIGAVVSGDNTGGNWLTAAIFFIIGQTTLLIMTYVFRWLTAYNDAEAIMQGNAAAALSYAGVMIGIAIIVGTALRGDFIDYPTSLIDYAWSLVIVVALYPIRQFLVQGVLLGCGFSFYGGKLDEEISKDRNIGAGCIEATTYIASALLATALL